MANHHLSLGFEGQYVDFHDALIVWMDAGRAAFGRMTCM